MLRRRSLVPMDTPDGIARLREAIDEAQTVVIGAGAGLSTSAGFEYAGERFDRYFRDLAGKYHFSDMYSGGFYPYANSEAKWAFWSRNIYVNRYMDPPKPVYERLLDLVRDKDYFVLTTNVDHCFQKAGFDKERLFYTQGDYGLWQCSKPCHNRTYDNADAVRAMVKAQGFVIAENGMLIVPEGTVLKTEVPRELIPHCPVCGKEMTMNLRVDDSFVEDEGWHRASERYAGFLRQHKNTKTLFLEAAVGWNTPGIIKLNFWRMVNEWPDATYACLNYGEASAPEEIVKKSICINGDIGDVLARLRSKQEPD